jgi:hypothetical protein
MNTELVERAFNDAKVRQGEEIFNEYKDNFIKNECELFNNMPELLWEVVYDMIDIEPVIHFLFKRNDLFYQNTYMVFSGTKKEFDKAIEGVRTDIEEDRLNSRDPQDLASDTPLDTFCNGTCREKGTSCDIKEKQKLCASSWENVEVYNTSEELSKRVEEIPKDYSYYGCYQVLII